MRRKRQAPRLDDRYFEDFRRFLEEGAERIRRERLQIARERQAAEAVQEG